MNKKNPLNSKMIVESYYYDSKSFTFIGRQMWEEKPVDDPKFHREDYLRVKIILKGGFFYYDEYNQKLDENEISEQPFKKFFGFDQNNAFSFRICRTSKEDK